MTYNTVEHFYQSEKAIFCGEERLAPKLLATDQPGKVKGLSYRMKNESKVKEVYATLARDTMYRGVKAKFAQHSELARYLEEDKSENIAEANPKDDFFSIGLGLKHET